MDGHEATSTSAFQYKPEYDDLLEEVASTDNVDVSQWPLLRDCIKYKINKNVAFFLSGAVKNEYSRSTVTAAPGPGGLKLPPFPTRERNDTSANDAPKNALNEKEAEDFKQIIYTQLDEFDKSPPFTLQRVSELSLRPTEHYKQIGKYLRAVEKSLLVTSTWDAFPLLPESTSGHGQPLIGATSLGTANLSVPSTPIFSPIPFLHEDARRSSSRSPPPSPLVLPAMGAGGTSTTMPHAGAEGAEQKALGLVDELDDPSPGHLSEHPQPLSATTTTTTVASKPLFESLQQRFVKARTEPKPGGGGTGATGDEGDSKSSPEEKKGS